MRRRLALLVALGAVPFAARASEPTRLRTLPPDEITRMLLEGRLVVHVPENTFDAPGATRSDDTRMFIDAGEERLEIHASELFATASSDFVEAATRVVKGWGREAEDFAVTPVALAGGMRGAEVVPGTPDPRPTGVFVRGLFVQSPDGTIQYLEARANALGARDFQAAAALAMRVLHSVAAGPRSMPAARGTCRLVTPNPELTVFADVPAGMASGWQRERDRTVHRFQPLAALGDSAPSLTLTFARDAVYLHERLNRDIKPVVHEGRLFGQKVLWHAWSAPRAESGKQQLEAIVTIGSSAHPLSAHVLILHRSEEQADEMRALAESMLAERRPPE